MHLRGLVMAVPKKSNQEHSPDFFPVTQSEQWLADEQLLLYDAEQGNVPVRQFKCTSCFCVNTYLADTDRAAEIMSTGRKMHFRPNCINNGCYCHTGLGPVKEIKTRIVDWGDIPF